jgi:hypothetical protein
MLKDAGQDLLYQPGEGLLMDRGGGELRGNE